MPGRVWDKAIEVATEQHGFITSKDIREMGENPVLLPQWCKRGLVERTAHGVYRFNQIPATGLTPYMLATLWPAGRGVLSHDTALELHELCDINPDKIHLTLPPSYRYRPLRRGGEQYVIHHEALDDTDLAWHEGIRIVAPAAAIRQTIESGVPTYLIRQALDTAGRLGRVRKVNLKELTDQGMRIVNAAKSKYYAAAHANFEQAKRCYARAGLEDEWAALVKQVRAEHSRKSSFMPGFEQIVAGRKESTPTFAGHAGAVDRDKS